MLISEILAEASKAEKRAARVADKEASRLKAGSNIDVSDVKAYVSPINNATNSKRSTLYNRIWNNDISLSNKIKLQPEINNFLRHKMTNGIITPYNKKDSMFTSGNSQLSSYWHCHLPNAGTDVVYVLIYKINGTVIEFHTISDHGYDTNGEKRLLIAALKNSKI